MFRGFIAVEIENKPLITNFRNELKKTGAEMKLVEKDNLHLTLKFLGNTKEEDIERISKIMEQSVAEIKPFKILLKDVGVFPSRNYIKVVWIGIENRDSLVCIANNLEEKLQELGFKKEKKNYVPHLTIARVKTSKNKEELLKVIEKYQGTSFGEQEIRDLKLFKSELTPKGPMYTILKKVSIKG
jgi:2'-5' RNA ligase